VLKRRSYRIAFLLSILLHIFLLGYADPILNLFVSDPLNPNENEPFEPLTVELVDPEQDAPQDLVETPEDARMNEAPEFAQALSDKNARAQDEYEADNLTQNLPYSDGVSQFKVFAGGQNAGVPEQVQQQQQQEEKQQDGEQKEPQEFENDGDQMTPAELGNVEIAGSPVAFRDRRKFSKELITGSPDPNPAGRDNFSDDVNWKNTESAAEALGGVSLSTYDWNFAPYLLYMKRRVKEHWYPPQTYLRDGSVTGKVVLKFTVRRDGTVGRSEFITHTGHESLIAPCLNAVKASDPFKPLPTDFPDPVLELTWTFYYVHY